MNRKYCLVGLVVCLTLLLSACAPAAVPAPTMPPAATAAPPATKAPATVPPAPTPDSATKIANTIAADAKSMVVDGAGPISAADPVQAKAEEEFRAAAIAKEQAFYAGDAQRLLSFYADDAISVQPGVPEVVGKKALAEGLVPYVQDNRFVGKFTLKQVWVYGDHATRLGEWEEVVTPVAGGKSEHHIGRCILNWVKKDGEWKVVSEFVNYLEPPTEIE
jgi:ketosteroid isomerase-like protein